MAIFEWENLSLKNKCLNIEQGTVRNANIDINVYNGNAKMAAEEWNFMTAPEIYECVTQLKIKNCEGYNRKPQRILIDGIDILISPLTILFTVIFRDRLIPERLMW